MKRRVATSCLNNLKQIGTALAMYQKDHDDTLPQAYYYRAGASASNAGYEHWTGMLADYVDGNKGIFVCPSDEIGGLAPTYCAPADCEGAGQVSKDAAATFVDNQAPRLSYVVNELVMPRKKYSSAQASAAQQASMAALRTVKSTYIKGASEVILMTEFNDNPLAVGGDSICGGAAIKSHRPTAGVSYNADATAYDAENNSNNLVGGLDGSGNPVAASAKLLATPYSVAVGSQDTPNASNPHVQYANYKRHNKIPNFLFVDGHVKAISLASTLNQDNFLWGKNAYSVTGNPTVYKSNGTTPVQ